ncbi:MAG TPA: helix-turn-helix transcriptional regulator [Phototrophicaceae bacterium]|jgi:transcriptional regulator with XRE-family HTH domain|nr:helix-turn-helix transcriptional regulator [Phototrophicaceae bacterium]
MTNNAAFLENGMNSNHQLALLLEFGVDTFGRSHTIQSIALATGIADQTLLNWLHGKTTSPRLNTIRAVCQVYGISLAYFDLETETACRTYLMRHHYQRFPLIHTINEIAQQLSPTIQDQLKSIIRWIRASETSKLTH